MYLFEAERAWNASPATERHRSVFEAAARPPITGRLVVAGTVIQPWVASGANEPGRAVYIETPEVHHTAPDPTSGTAEGYYFPGGEAHEACVLLTLFTRAHFSLQRRLFLGGMPLLWTAPTYQQVAETPVDTVAIQLTELAEAFTPLRELWEAAAKDAKSSAGRALNRFLLASRLYHMAVWLREADITLAYACLVMAVESVLPQQREGIDAAPDLIQIVREHVPPGPACERIVSCLEKPTRKLADRFAQFIVEGLTDKYWGDPTRPASSRLNSLEDVGMYARRIYRARNGAVHDGEPMPPLVEFGARVEVPIGKGLQVGTRKWDESQMIPTFRAFECIVHHVLVDHLARRCGV